MLFRNIYSKCNVKRKMISRWIKGHTKVIFMCRIVKEKWKSVNSRWHKNLFLKNLKLFSFLKWTPQNYSVTKESPVCPLAVGQCYDTQHIISHLYQRSTSSATWIHTVICTAPWEYLQLTIVQRASFSIFHDQTNLEIINV